MSILNKKLTPEQQKLFLDNYNLIFAAWRHINSHEFKLRYKDDLIGVGEIALCDAVCNFDPSRASLSTFAFKVIYGSMMHALRKWYKSYKNECSLDLQLEKSINAEEADLNNILPDLAYAESVEKTQTASDVLRILTKRCDAQSMKILYYIMQGYTYLEIGKMMGCTKQNIGLKVNRMRRIVKENWD